MARVDDLVLDNSGFFFKDVHHDYTDVTHLYFHYVQVQKSLNFVSSGIDHQIDAKIYVRQNREPLRMKTGPGFLSLHGGNFGKKTSELLLAKWSELSAKTFLHRLKPYVDALSQ